jgi:class 3 adenylate cyclase
MVGPARICAMTDIVQIEEPSVGIEPKQTPRIWLFGSLALLGAGASLLFCYGQVLISLTAPLLGLAAFQLNIHVQALFMWAFALVTVIGLARDRRRHHSNLPLLMSACAVIIIVGTLYPFYDVRILILGYVLLVIAALLNQNVMLGSLNLAVQRQAGRLQELNSTLEERVQTQVAEIERLARLKRFLSTPVADLITTQGKESLLESHRRLIGCLFCDVRNFTKFSEAVEPEEVMDVLQSVHEHVGRLVAERQGTIGYRAGDGLMVIFNDPLPCTDPVLEAVKLAVEMKGAFEEIRARWRKLGHDLGIGIGIAYGYATLGLIGSEGRYDYTPIGNVVNIAARLCDRAGDGEILIDQHAYLEIEEDARIEPVGRLELKGVGKQVETYKVLGLRG